MSTQDKLVEALRVAREWLNSDKWRNSTIDKHKAWEAMMRGIDAALAEYDAHAAEAAQAQAQAQSGEWVMVPRKITPEMEDAADRRDDEEPPSDWGKMRNASRQAIWSAMLAAAPQPQAAEPVAFRYLMKISAGAFAWSAWLPMDSINDRAFPGDKIEYAYTHPQPARDAKDAKDAKDAWPEEWRSFAEGYEVSSHGRTRSKGRLLQPYVKGKGYLAVSVWHGGKNKEMYVHRVVASAFCRRDDPSQDQVNHRDGDKLNNYASNLEWCTAKENRMHAARVLFSATRSVVGTNLKTGETITFRSLAEAEEHGFIRANIQKCIAGVRKKHGGFTWRDADTAIDAAMAKEFGR